MWTTAAECLSVVGLNSDTVTNSVEVAIAPAASLALYVCFFSDLFINLLTIFFYFCSVMDS